MDVSVGARTVRLFFSVFFLLFVQLFATQLAYAQGSGAATVLTAGRAVNDSFSTSGWKYYKITAQGRLRVDLSELSADVDLYVRTGAKPNANVYQCRPYLGSTLAESCVLNLNQRRTVFIGVRGYQSSSFKLRAQVIQPVVQLQENRGRRGNVAANSWSFYKITAAGDMKISVFNMTADVDVYVRRGRKPNLNNFSCFTNNAGLAAEVCRMRNGPNPQTLFVGVRGKSSRASFTIKAKQETTFTPTVLSNDVPVYNSVAQGAWRYYRIAGTGRLDVRLDNLDADADLYVKKGNNPPSTSNFDCQSSRAGTEADSCNVTLSGGQSAIIGVYGFRAANYRLRATLPSFQPGAPTQIYSGQVVSNTVTQDNWRYYRITGSGELSVDLYNLTADADLYVRKGNTNPTISAYSCASNNPGSISDSCSVTLSNGQSAIIGVKGFSSGATGYSLRANVESPQNSTDFTAISMNQVRSSSVSQDSWQYFRLRTSGDVRVRLYNLSNDADLYVRAGDYPTLEVNDCVSARGSTAADECTVNLGSANQYVYIGVFGYRSASFSVQATRPFGGGGNSGTSSIRFDIADGCNDGYRINYRFFDRDNNLRWPAGGGVYYTSALNQTYTSYLSCETGGLVCYGAESSDQYFTWGVGINDNSGCTDCCITCEDGNSLSRTLVCE
ncbi:hypothetical protein A3709_11345 [Halioglobus sp. HI00S01]|uniref:pre-peptidase C-terminal domain-containing protein n=1 Tax=Halioglobus sp. HI00S01 TaxID=1822214 RepID=UPI0007C2631E|nr:pre-peptidase C-terminal domain-containing protein [Halioglobus sp. HI00S01]KZX50342.1 hypothetical protein A3709_11345 [Halioglobus sp. HI00S01]